MVGKIHKKKLSEYTDASDHDDKHASDDEAGDDCLVDQKDLMSGSGSENGDAGNKKLNKSNDSADANDEEDEEEEDDEDHKDEDEDGAKSVREDSNDEEDATASDSAGDFADDKKGKKRKANEKPSKDDDTDDEAPNGITPKKRGRKTSAKNGAGKAAAKAQAKNKVKKGKKSNEDEDAGGADEGDDNDDEQEEEYEVKDIVGHKTERGVQYFLIRWKGYTKDDDTWEPEDTLNCAEIIQRYKKKHDTTAKAKKGASPAKKTKAAAVEKKKGGAKTKKAAVNDDEDGDDEEQEWEVEKILDYAEEKNGRVFRIRWKGFGSKHDTWEPEDNLNCSDIIEKFLKRMKSQENISFKELREEPKKTKRLANETLPRTNISNRISRTSKRTATKNRVFYGDMDE